jgi:hypothetical protein
MLSIDIKYPKCSDSNIFNFFFFQLFCRINYRVLKGAIIDLVPLNDMSEA